MDVAVDRDLRRVRVDARRAVALIDLVSKVLHLVEALETGRHQGRVARLCDPLDQAGIGSRDEDGRHLVLREFQNHGPVGKLEALAIDTEDTLGEGPFDHIPAFVELDELVFDVQAETGELELLIAGPEADDTAAA